MAYNKRKHFEQNLAAIKTAFASDLPPTPQEEDALRKYSGFGGLKCILLPAQKDSDIEK